MRYLWSGGVQTGLILSGVAVGVIVYAFIAALINGVQDQLIEDTLGNVSHVAVSSPPQEPRLVQKTIDARPFLAAPPGIERRPSIENWRPLLEAIEQVPGVIAVSPQAVTAGFAQYVQRSEPVSIIGVLPPRVNAIIEIEENLIRGTSELRSDDVIIGTDLADDLNLEVGRSVTLTSDLGISRTLRVAGIYSTGVGEIDQRLALVDLRSAQQLLGIVGAVTQIELQIADVFRAKEKGAAIEGLTRLETTNWITREETLFEALRAQGDTGTLIKTFAILLITIAVSSALLISALKRRPEIGIMRSMGVERSAIVVIFVLQGFLIGLAGSLLGAGLGWVFISMLREATIGLDGEPALPVDPAQGEYWIAIALATLASSFAAILPARSAAKVDPVEVIQT